MFWQWVVDLGLERKDKELAHGWDKNGKVHRLKPKTIKYRKSEVGPVHPNAPRLIPALNLSRVRSLLTGRAHTTSAEFWWKFDSVTGESFATILHYQADEYGHDVFGLSPQGTAAVKQAAAAKWQAWIAGGGGVRATQAAPGGRAVRKPEFLKPIFKVPLGRMDIANFDISSNGEKLKAAIAAGQFTGFRRLNARGEQWRPGIGIPRP